MKTKVSAFALAVGLLLGVPASGRAQFQVGIGISFPAPPPLVVVQPGIQVVPEMNEDVFFVSGYYWVCHDGTWYRTADWRGGWQWVPIGWVPPALVRIPPGRYRYYYRDDQGRWKAHEAAEYHAWQERHSYGERWASMRGHNYHQQGRREERHGSREEWHGSREHEDRHGEDRGGRNE